jgi:hypothetical protein
MCCPAFLLFLNLRESPNILEHSWFSALLCSALLCPAIIVCFLLSSAVLFYVEAFLFFVELLCISFV